MGQDLKVQRPLLALAARTASTACVPQFDRSQQFIRLYLNVTVAGGGTGIKVVIRGYDVISGLPVAITAGGVAITAATGIYVYELVSSANVAAGAVMESVSRFLPVAWDAQVVHSDAASFTYSLSAELAPPG